MSEYGMMSHRWTGDKNLPVFEATSSRNSERDKRNLKGGVLILFALAVICLTQKSGMEVESQQDSQNKCAEFCEEKVLMQSRMEQYEAEQIWLGRPKTDVEAKFSYRQ